MEVSSSLLRVFPFLFSAFLEFASLPIVDKWSGKFEKVVADNSGPRTDIEWITDASIYYLLEYTFWIGISLTSVSVLVVVLQSNYSLLWILPIGIGLVAHQTLRPEDYSMDATTGFCGLRIPEIVMIIVNLSYAYIFC